MTKNIKRVVLFETPDGERHDTYAKAQSHLRRDQARKELSDFVVENGGWGGPGPSSDDVVDFLVDNRGVLFDMLGRLR